MLLNLGKTFQFSCYFCFTLSHGPLILTTTEQHVPPCSTQHIGASLAAMSVFFADYLVRKGSAFISTSSPPQRRHTCTNALCRACDYRWLLSYAYYTCLYCVFVISVSFLALTFRMFFFLRSTTQMFPHCWPYRLACLL